MTSCFKPDIFSLPKPKWHSVDSETAQKVLKITSAMGLVIGDTLPEQVIGQEINSNNYRLKLADGKVVVLKASATQASSSYRGISEHFVKNGIPVPRQIPIDKNVYEISYDGFKWSLSEFVDGEYFSGRIVELQNLALLLAKLLHMVGNVPKINDIQAWDCPSFSAQSDLLDEVTKREADWPLLFGNDGASFLRSKWKKLYQYWSVLSNHPPDLSWEGIMHFDLHPHNILCRDKKIAALLDLDSFWRGPLGVAIAFGGLKLCRQTVVYQRTSVRAAAVGKRFVQVLAKNLQHLPIKELEFSRLAHLEVFRRIFLIMGLNFYHGNSEWNHVLPIQIGHLSEAEKLFE